MKRLNFFVSSFSGRSRTHLQLRHCCVTSASSHTLVPQCVLLNLCMVGDQVQSLQQAGRFTVRPQHFVTGTGLLSEVLSWLLVGGANGVGLFCGIMVRTVHSSWRPVLSPKSTAKFDVVTGGKSQIKPYLKHQ